MGLVEELLDEPSRVLLQNRNLVIDILLEIQALFKSCVAIQAKYDQLAPQKLTETERAVSSEETFDRRFPRGTNLMLSKTLSFLQKIPEMPKRLQWAVVKREEFESLVLKLIDYNTSIEALLDRTALDQLQLMQQQTYMAMLQLNSNVIELKEMSLAMQIKTAASSQAVETPAKLNSNTESDQQVNYTNFARLADFKAQQMQLETEPMMATLEPISRNNIILEVSDETRSEAIYQGKHIWIEWKHYSIDHDLHSEWNRIIEDRIKKLAILLSSSHKPSQFNAPQCLGYFHATSDIRYGLLYLKPADVSKNTPPKSLLDIIQSSTAPSLTKRIALAHTIARSLMYLHSVNWLHKGLRSNNILFFTSAGQTPSYAQPLIAGFEYARPDFPDEYTEPPPEHSEHDIYRHPAIVARTISRSQKSHDVYSLGIILVEIAYWKRIDEIMEMPREIKAARSRVRKVRELLLKGGYLEFIEGAAGEAYANTVRTCLVGGEELGVQEHVEESNKEVGVRIQKAFAEKVVGKLGEIRV